MSGPTYTTAEVAEHLRCGTRKIRNVARELGVGLDLGGKAGCRYTQADVDAIWDFMRPVQQVAPRRRRRNAA